MPRTRRCESLRPVSLLAALLLFLWAALVPPALCRGVQAAESSEGERTLQEIAARFQNLETFQAEFIQKQDWVGLDEDAGWRGTLYLKRPNLFRLEYREPAGHLQVSDGRTVWTYVPENGEVLATSLGAAGRGGDLLRWILETGRAEPLVTQDRVEGQAARVVALTPDEGLGLSRVRLWVRAGSPELLQYEITDSSGNRTLYRLTRVRWNPKLSPSLFQFVAPPGVPVVELGNP